MNVSPSRSPSAEKIREAAKQLGYRRDYVASSLRRGDTGTIGVLVPRLTDTVTAMFYEAVSQAAARQGYFTVVATCGNDPDTEERATQSLLDRRVDGLILPPVARMTACLSNCGRNRSTMFWRCVPTVSAHPLLVMTNWEAIWQPATYWISVIGKSVLLPAPIFHRAP